MNIVIPVSPGELIDRITILEIKAERLRAPDRRAHVTHELDLLRSALRGAALPQPEIGGLSEGLGAINRQLWQVEDSLREREDRQDFGPTFISLARSVYRLNDERARLKRLINETCGSALREEKLYAEYR
jgi:hypothetical protein